MSFIWSHTSKFLTLSLPLSRSLFLLHQYNMINYYIASWIMPFFQFIQALWKKKYFCTHLHYYYVISFALNGNIEEFFFLPFQSLTFSFHSFLSLIFSNHHRTSHLQINIVQLHYIKNYWQCKRLLLLHQLVPCHIIIIQHRLHHRNDQVNQIISIHRHQHRYQWQH